MLTDTPEPHSLSFSLFFFGCHLFFTIRLICLKPKIAWLNLYFLVWMCVLQIYYKHFGEMSISHNTFSAYHFHSNQIARFTIIVQLCLSFLSKKESHFILFEPKIRKKSCNVCTCGKKEVGKYAKEWATEEKNKHVTWNNTFWYTRISHTASNLNKMDKSVIRIETEIFAKAPANSDAGLIHLFILCCSIAPSKMLIVLCFRRKFKPNQMKWNGNIF